MDLGLSTDPEESFKIFQGMIKKHYDNMIEEEHFNVINATQSVEEQQAIVRTIIKEHLDDYVSPTIYWEERV